jgi:hypothetical protein
MDKNLYFVRRNLAALQFGSPAPLTREDALDLIRRVETAEARVVELERTIHEAAVRRHPAAG